MNKNKLTLGKQEKLCSRKRITELFEKGKVVYTHPFKVFYLPKIKNEEDPTQFLVSVPKRLFKKAAHRNKIKRLVRESLRFNKHIIYETGNNYDISIVYTGKSIPDYNIAEKKIKDVLEKIKTHN